MNVGIIHCLSLSFFHFCPPTPFFKMLPIVTLGENGSGLLLNARPCNHGLKLYDPFIHIGMRRYVAEESSIIRLVTWRLEMCCISWAMTPASSSGDRVFSRRPPNTTMFPPGRATAFTTGDLVKKTL